MSTLIAVKSGTTNAAEVSLHETRDIFKHFKKLTNEIAQRAFGLFQGHWDQSGRASLFQWLALSADP